MTRPKLRLLGGIALLATSSALAIDPARAGEGDDFQYERPPASTTWFGVADPTAKKADLDYLTGMRPHHAGALSMSEEYLADPASSSPALRQMARAIIVNQRFEIALLDQVGRDLAEPIVALPFGIRLQPMGTEGVAQAKMFRAEPVIGPMGYAVGPVSPRDVLFAKAMTIHHQGALDMAKGYLADPAAKNGFLGLFNVDVTTDQSMEIALMRRIVAGYPGDANAITVDPSMVHGMEGMTHGAHAMPMPAAAQPVAKASPPHHAAMPGMAHGHTM